METRYTSIGYQFTARFSVDDLPANDKANLLRNLLDKAGLTDIIFTEMKKNEDFAHQFDLAFQKFRDGE